MSAPDTRARIASVWDDLLSQPLPMASLIPSPDGTPKGMVAWAVGIPPTPRSIVILPEISDTAPPEVMHRYMSRVVATATGRCPLCGRAAGLVGADTLDPDSLTRGRAAYYLSPLVVDVRHDVGCPAVFTDDEAHWFPFLSREERP